MFTIKNAIKNIYRYKNKYILFGIIYLVLILGSAILIALFVSMHQVTENILREYAGVARLSPSGTQSNDESRDRFSKEQYLELKNIEHISDIRFSRYNFAVRDFQRRDIAELEVELDINGEIMYVNIDPEWVFISGLNKSLMHLLPEELDIERGRMFENDGEAVIGRNSRFVPISSQVWDESSQSVVELELQYENEQWNDLDLGDKITIRNDDGFRKEFNIVGVLKENPDDDIGTNRRIIYTTFEGAEYFNEISRVEGTRMLGYNFQRGSLAIESVIGMGYEVFVYMDTPEAFFDVNNQLWDLKLGDDYFRFLLEPLFPNFRELANLSRIMRDNSIAFAILIFIIILILTFISTLISLNSRKYEIAILRSVGMKRSRIIMNYLIENLAFIWSISVVSLIAAQFISPMFTVSVFEGMRDLVSPEIFEQLTDGGNLKMILQNAGLVFSGTTAVVMVSLVLACINIVRFEPLKIFNKQY